MKSIARQTTAMKPKEGNLPNSMHTEPTGIFSHLYGILQTNAGEVTIS